MTDEMVFDSLEPKVVPVRIGGAKYTLREASGDAAVRWRNAILKTTRITDGKPSGIDGMADTEPLLVSLCLFDEGGKNVPITTVRGWPQRVQSALFAKVKEISGLNPEEDTRASLLEARAEIDRKLDALVPLAGTMDGSSSDGRLPAPSTS